MEKFSVRKPITVFVCVIVIIALGIVSVLKMTPDLLPSIDLPYVVVMTTYPGATPEEVENTVTKPLEQSLATVENLKSIQSISSANYSIIILEFENGSSMDTAIVNTLQYTDLVEGSWDDRIGSPYILKLNPSMMPITIAAVDKENSSTEDVSNFVDETLMTQLEGITGVASISTAGLIESQINVVINEKKIDKLNDKLISKVNKDLAKSRKQVKEGLSAIKKAEAEIKKSKDALAVQKDATYDQLTGSMAAVDSSLAQANIALNNAQGATAAAPSTAGPQSTAGTQNAAGTPSTADIQNALGNMSAEEIQSAMGTMSAADLQKLAKNLSLSDIRKLTKNMSLSELQKLAGMMNSSGTQSAEATAPQPAQEQNTAETESTDSTDEMPSASEQAQTAVDQLQTAYSQIEKGAITAQEQFRDAEEQMANAESQIASNKKKLNSALSQIDKAADEALKQANLGSMITLDMVSGVLQGQNFNMPAGYIQDGDVRYLVSVGDKMEDVDTVKEMYLFNVDGIGDIRLSDVADVFIKDNSEEIYGSINGNPGVLLTFSKQSNYATADVSNNIKEKFSALEDKYDGIKFTILMDQGEYIYLIIDAILESLLYGALFAVLILLIFLRDIKPTFITLLSIPISLTFAIVLMYFTGVTINMISLSGLAVSVGMLVDNSIVVIENTFRLRRLGVPPKKAAVAGAKQVAAAITSSTLTTICVFVPIIFTHGITRQLFTDMALTIGYSLVASLLIALTLVPALSSLMFRKDPKPEGTLFMGFRKAYARLLRWNLRHKLLILVVAVVLLAYSLIAALEKGLIFIPDMATPQQTGYITMNDEEATLDETKAASDEVLERLSNVDGVETVGGMLSSTGSMSSLTGETSTNTVTLYIIIDQESDYSSNEIAENCMKACEDMKDCKVEIISSSSVMEYTSALGGEGVTVNVYSTDQSKLNNAAKSVANVLSEVEGIKKVNDGLQDAEPEYHFVVDKDKAMKKGLTVAQIYMAIQKELTYEKSPTSMIIDANEVDIVVSTGDAQSITLKDLKNLEVEGQNGAVKVKKVAEVIETESLPAINRLDQRTYISVRAELEEGYNVTLVTEDCEKALGKATLPAGVSYEFNGENEMILDAMEDLLLMMALAIVLVYLIMVAQFQSLRSPFIVMFTIPLAFTGGLLALLIANKEISIIAMIGLIMLVGIIVNNGIVLVDYTNQLRAAGMSKKEAIVEAGSTRMRPVLMTSLTTILGLIVMAIGKTAGTDVMQPIALTCIGGLVYATALTLLVVPIMYDIMNPEEYKITKKDDLDVSDIIVE